MQTTEITLVGGDGDEEETYTLHQMLVNDFSAFLSQFLAC